MSVVKLADRDEAYHNEVVAKLEELLAAAKRGEILSIMYMCDRPGGAVTSGSTRVKDRFLMLGYLFDQMWQLGKSLDESSTPSEMLGLED